jgi:hypothetical protein
MVGVWKMKKLLLCLLLLCLVCSVASADDIVFKNITAVYGTPYCESGSGCPADNLIDGNIASWLTLDVSHGQVRIYADQYYEWTSCDIYHARPDANREVLFRFNTSNNPKTTYGIAVKNAWTTINIPANISNVLYFSTTDAQWFGLNELKCHGTPYTPIVKEGEYGNLTINVKSAATTAVNIENAYIEYQYHPLAGAFGRTDINGNITFMGIEQNITPHTLSAYATGYGYYEEQYAFTKNNAFKQIYLNPINLPNSTNFIKVNMRDSSNNMVLDDLHLFVYDFNTSEWYERYSMNGVEYITLVGTAGNKPLIYGDSYTFVATKNGYISANETITYEYGGQVVDLYLDYVTHEGELEIWADVVDAENGYTIGGAMISLWDNYHKEWKNKTAATGAIAISASGTNGQYPITVGTNYTICGSANGYSKYCTEPFRFKLENDKVPFILPLSLLGVAPTGNFTTTIKVIDYDTRYPIAGTAITLSNGQGVTTNTQGVAKLISPAGSYTISAYKDGYAGATQTITGADGQNVAVNFELMKGTSYPTLTPTPAPTLTYIGGQPIGEPAVCGISDGTVFGYMLAYIACWGANDRYTQNLILASLIIIVFMFFGARYGKGLGAAIGAAAGFVISVAMNLIPLWVFFAMVIITGLIFGLRLYTANK